MKYKILTLLITLSLFVTASLKAQDAPSKKLSPWEQEARSKFYFYGSMKELKNKVTAEKRPYIMFINDPECKECKKADSSFRSPKMSKFIEDKRIVVVDYDASSFRNLYRASNWGINGVPSYVLFNDKGEIAYRNTGYMNPDKMLDELTVAMKRMLDQNNQYTPKIHN